jgi:UrcA family protein
MNIQNTKNAVRMTVVAIAAMSAAVLAGVTHAAETGDTLPNQVVVFKDLNLNSNAGVQVLYRRIQGAADQVCGKVDTRDLRGMSARKVCVERAIANAVATVDSRMLTTVSVAKANGNGMQSVAVAQVR